jgi:hypothetical protein
MAAPLNRGSLGWTMAVVIMASSLTTTLIVVSVPGEKPVGGRGQGRDGGRSDA